MRILIVEDQKKVASFIRKGLQKEGYAADIVHNGTDAVQNAALFDYDLLILDLMLPTKSGLDVLREIRSKKPKLPVLVLTAKGAVNDRVAGLDAGADDYLIKPFAFAELLARIRALVRRGRVTETPRLLVGDLEMDLVTRKVTRASQPVELTVREFELLEYLMRYHGQVVSRETLARDVWKETARTTPLDNVIDVHIARLRRKVDLEHSVKLIHTVRGVGFMLREGEP